MLNNLKLKIKKNDFFINNVNLNITLFIYFNNSIHIDEKWFNKIIYLGKISTFPLGRVIITYKVIWIYEGK